MILDQINGERTCTTSTTPSQCTQKALRRQRRLGGSLYCGISLNWHYDKGCLDISTPNYMSKQLAQYVQRPPRRPQHSPYEPSPVHYGKKSDEIVPKEQAPPSKLEKNV